MEFNENFCSLLKSRMLKGVFFAFAFQLVPIAILTGITFMNIFHPLLWIWNVVSHLISLRSWLTLVPVLLSMLFVGVIKVQNLSSVRVSPVSTYQIIRNIFVFNSIIRSISFLLLSMFLPLAYMAIVGQNFYHQCSGHKDLRCIDGRMVFTFSCAFWSGLCFYLQSELWSKAIKFPIIGQVNFLQKRFKAVSILKASPRRALLPVIYFFPVYFLFNSFVTNLFCKIYSARVEPDNKLFFDVINLSVFLKSWIYSAMVYFSMQTLRTFIHMHLTEPYSFPLPALSNALKLRDHPFVRHLAFYDLALLSTGRRGDISEIYSLSQPGGVPHTWNSVFQECEQVILEFQQEIEILLGEKERPSLTAPSFIAEETAPRVHSVRLRKLVDTPASPRKAVTPTECSNETYTKIMSTISAMPPVRFFFSPVPELHLAAILEGSQQVVWAVESISSLASRALVEDRYGVVVNNVPLVVTMILSLRSTMEKVKVGGQRKQRQRDRAARMRTAVLSAVRRGLCKIAVTYADYLDHLKLPDNALYVMKNYASLKVY